MKRLAKATGVALALLLSVYSPAANAAEVTLDKVTKQKTDVRSSGAAGGRALSLQIHSASGVTSLTIGQNEGALSTSYDMEEYVVPHIDDALLRSCSTSDLGGSTAIPVLVNGQSQCLDRQALTAAGLDLPDNRDAVEVVCFPGQPACPKPDLASAGLVRLVDNSNKSPIAVNDLAGKANGLLLPNVAQGAVACDKGKPSDSKTGLALPDSLKGVLTLSAAFGSCTASGLKVEQNSGVADLGLTVTQTLFNTQVGTTGLNSTLDTVQQQLQPLPATLTTPVNNTIDNIQEEISKAPVLDIDLGPNVSSVVGTDQGAITAQSGSRAAAIKLLNGLATIEIAAANATAAVSGDPRTPAPTAKADPALVRIKVLNLTAVDPNAEPPLLNLVVDPRDLQKSLAALPDVAGVIETNDDGVVLFRGTPLETHISFAKGFECAKVGACTLDGAAGTFDSVASASAVRVTAFGRPTAAGATTVGPLPAIDLRLAEAQAAAVSASQARQQAYNIPLARTGATAFPTMFFGLGLVATAAIIRRRFAS